MSAQVNSAGLFEPKSDEQWNANLTWQPVPIHTTPVHLDYTLFFGRYCKKYEDLFEKNLKESKEVQRIFKEYAVLFKHWSLKSGLNIRSIRDVYELYNTLHIEKEQNKS